MTVYSVWHVIFIATVVFRCTAILEMILSKKPSEKFIFYSALAFLIACAPLPIMEYPYHG